MSQKERLFRILRLASGLLCAGFGIASLLLEGDWLTAATLTFSAAWLYLTLAIGAAEMDRALKEEQ